MFKYTSLIILILIINILNIQVCIINYIKMTVEQVIFYEMYKI